MTDMVLVGRVANIQRQNGTSQMGREWTSTSFNLERTKVKKGQNGVYENYTESIPLSGFGELGLVEGGIYQVGIDVKTRQSQNGGAFATLSVQWAEAVWSPQTSQTRNNNNGYQPSQQYNQPQQGYYQQGNGYQNQQYNQPPMNGQENFRNDDIPF